MGYAQLVIGPAGSGKSTYCSSLYNHCAARRPMHILNLDPAAENFEYPVAMDIRELISLDDVMEEVGLSPNGSPIYSMEHLEDNLDLWFNEQLENYLDDDYLVFDCPDQVEFCSHVPVLKNFVEHLKHTNFNACAVYLLDSQVCGSCSYRHISCFLLGGDSGVWCRSSYGFYTCRSAVVDGAQDTCLRSSRPVMCRACPVFITLGL